MSRLIATSERVAAKVAIPPLVIEAVILALSQLITWCLAPEPTPAEILKAAQKPSHRQRRGMENAVWKELLSRGLQSKYVPTMRALHGEISLLTEDDVTEICEDCQKGTRDYGG